MNVAYVTKNSAPREAYLKKLTKLKLKEEVNVKWLFILSSISLYLVSGNSYDEQGVVGYDTIDGNIGNKANIEGTVDINTPGEYLISYTAS